MRHCSCFSHWLLRGFTRENLLDFQSFGAATAKARSPLSFRLVLGWSADLREWARPFRDLKTNKIILKSILKCMGSQWSEAKMGEMCSNSRVPVKRRVAVFCPIWRRAYPHINLITVIQPSGDKGVNYHFKVLPQNNWLYFGQLPQLKKAWFNNGPDLVVKLQIRVNFNPQVCDSVF